FDWSAYRASYDLPEPENPWTPAISLVQGVRAALELYFADGADAALERHRVLAMGVKEGVRALGLDLFGDNPEQAWAVTAIRAPDQTVGCVPLWVCHRHPSPVRTRTAVTRYGITRGPPSDSHLAVPAAVTHATSPEMCIRGSSNTRSTELSGSRENRPSSSARISCLPTARSDRSEPHSS